MLDLSAVMLAVMLLSCCCHAPVMLESWDLAKIGEKTCFFAQFAFVSPMDFEF